MRSPRWQLGVAALAGLLAAAAPRAQAGGHGPTQAPGQSPAPAATPAQPAEAKRGSQAAPSHRPQPLLRPLAALQHLQAAAARADAPPPAHPRPGTPAERPAGAGRYVAAVVVCADADFDAAATFGMPRQDLLVLQTAGGLLDRDSIALLEHFASEERLSLIVLLGHQHCAARQLRGNSRAQAGLAARLRALGETFPAPAGTADATWVPLQRQRDALLDASELLGGLARADRLRVVLAWQQSQHEAQPAIEWRAEAVSTLPLAPVK